MPPRLSHSLLTLLIDDRGAGLWTAEGRCLGALPDAPPGPGKRAAWAAALRDLAEPGTEVQFLLAHSTLSVQCQDAPYLTVREQREVALRTAAAEEEGGGGRACAATLDPDPSAEGGHVLWIASHPGYEMADWLGALQGAGLSMVQAVPLQRVLLRGLEAHGDLPRDRILLVVKPGREGHLLIFRGRSLQLTRAFALSGDPDADEEVLYEEVSRLLQFYKQKHRELAFKSLFVVGLAEISSSLQTRIQGTLRLEAALLATDYWPLLQQGCRLERSRRDGLNLVPLEVRQALQRRLFTGTVWVAAVLLAGLFVIAGGVLLTQEAMLRREVLRSAQTLAERESHGAEDTLILNARLPLLRVRLAEARQADAIRTTSRLAARLLEAPQGIQLEKVEILEAGGDARGHRFTVTGLSTTSHAFSMGPLAQYLYALGREPGLKLAPVSEVSVSDRMEEGRERIEQRAVTRFTLQGTAP